MCAYAIVAAAHRLALTGLRESARKARTSEEVDRMNNAKNIGITAVLIPLTLYAAACGSDTNTDAQSIHTEEVSKSTFKGPWPVIPDSGLLACDTSKDDAITFTPT